MRQEDIWDEDRAQRCNTATAGMFAPEVLGPAVDRLAALAGDGHTQARLSRSPHRYIWPSELDLMGQLAGFELAARHADWAGAEFTAESRSHVLVYRLPAAP